MSRERLIESPYLIFTGDAQDEVVAKTAFGIVQWRRADCLAQATLPGCTIDLGLPRLSPREAVSRGARTLVIGIAPPGGALPQHWIAALGDAIRAGRDLASGLHVRLRTIPALANTAALGRRKVNEVPHPPRTILAAHGCE